MTLMIMIFKWNKKGLINGIKQSINRSMNTTFMNILLTNGLCKSLWRYSFSREINSRTKKWFRSRGFKTFSLHRHSPDSLHFAFSFVNPAFMYFTTLADYSTETTSAQLTSFQTFFWNIFRHKYTQDFGWENSFFCLCWSSCLCSTSSLSCTNQYTFEGSDWLSVLDYALLF